MTSFSELALRFSATRAETFHEAIDRGNAWSAAVVAAGFEQAIVDEFGECDDAVRVIGAPATEEQLSRIEIELGCVLPPSYRRFLGEVGAVAFFNYWWDETTAVESIVSTSTVLTDEDTDFDWRHDPVWSSLPPGPLLRVSDHHNGDDWFLVTAASDSSGEAPVVLGYHDEPHLHHADALRDPPAAHAPFERWLSDQVDRTIAFVIDRAARHLR